MHKAIYCVCLIYEHSTKSEELLYPLSLYIGAPGADILGILGDWRTRVDMYPTLTHTNSNGSQTNIFSESIV